MATARSRLPVALGLLMGTVIGDGATTAIAWCGAIAAGGYLWSGWLFRRKTRR